MTHTRTPWALRTYDDIDCMPSVIEGDLLYHLKNDPSSFYGRWIVTFPRLKTECAEQQRIDAEFIVKACNAHDEFVSEVESLLRVINDWPSMHEEGDYLHGGATLRLRTLLASLTEPTCAQP